jgi:hypothetical protein
MIVSKHAFKARNVALPAEAINIYSRSPPEPMFLEMAGGAALPIQGSADVEAALILPKDIYAI